MGKGKVSEVVIRLPITKILVGIDPDVNRSGVAVWCPVSMIFLELTDCRLFELFVKLGDLHERHELFVYLEDASLSKGMWHKGGIGAAKNVGKNMAITNQIRAYMDANHIPYQLLKPSGYSKYNHESFCMITGWPKQVRTNNEKRAAGVMVYGRKK